MSFVQKISDELTESMRGGDTERLAVLRLLKTSLKNEQIKVMHELSDEEALKIVIREAKQRRDSITQFEAAGRKDLADAEKAELVLIEQYLPKQLDEAELASIVDKVISETGATTKAQMGQVMGLVMKQTAGAADGGLVSKLVASKLA